MRKWICLILVLICLPVVAFSDETDPIIGSWYFNIDLSVTPELKASFPDFDQIVVIYFFGNNGFIYCSDLQIKDLNGESLYSVVGRWTKDDSSYYVNILGVGENIKTHIIDDYILMEVPNMPYYMKMQKLLAFNPYQDYIFVHK